MSTPELNADELVTVAQNGRLLRIGALVHNDPEDPKHWKVTGMRVDPLGLTTVVVTPASKAAEEWLKGATLWNRELIACEIIEVGTERGIIW